VRGGEKSWKGRNGGRSRESRINKKVLEEGFALDTRAFNTEKSSEERSKKEVVRDTRVD